MAGSRRAVRGNDHRAQKPKKGPSLGNDSRAQTTKKGPRSKTLQGKYVGDRMLRSRDRFFGFRLDRFVLYLDLAYLIDQGMIALSCTVCSYIPHDWIDLFRRISNPNADIIRRVYRFCSIHNHAVLLYNLCHPAYRRLLFFQSFAWTLIYCFLWNWPHLIFS